MLLENNQLIKNNQTIKQEHLHNFFSAYFKKTGMWENERFKAEILKFTWKYFLLIIPR